MAAWGDYAKIATPIVAGYLGSKAKNRTEENTNVTNAAAAAELAKLNRAKIGVDRDRLGMDQEAQAVANMIRSQLMRNTKDVNFDRSGFRSTIPNVSFSGGSRPSALGSEADRGMLADVVGNRALQTLLRPAGGDGASAGSSSGYGEYEAPETKGISVWEQALGAGMTGLEAADKLGFLGKTGAKAGVGASNAELGRSMVNVPGSSNADLGRSMVNVPGAMAGGGALSTMASAGLPGVNVTQGGSLLSALGPGGTSVTPWAPSSMVNVPGSVPGSSMVNVPGAASVAGGVPGGSFWSGANSAAGPIGMGLGIASGFLPAGKARTAADWAGKGAQIGSFLPGPGTLIGLGVGAAAGAIKGHQNATVGDREKLAKKLGYGSLDKLYRALEGMGPEGMKLRHEGLRVIGKHDEKENQQWIGQVSSLLGRR